MIANIAINTPARVTFSTQKSKKSAQRGITLVMVLIFIVTLSLIAAVGMRGVMTAERVVANERDRALAFQAAESTIREAVTLISAPTPTYKSVGILPLGGNMEHWRTTSSLTAATTCDPVPLAESATTRFNWTMSGTNCSISSTSKYNNAVEPKYIIENMPTIPVGVSAAPTNKDCWYRITARATGGTQEADVILQAMFSLQKLTAELCSPP